jgi:23S rRNA pseudouridine2605 synthase
MSKPKRPNPAAQNNRPPETAPEPEEGERIQKVLAHAGLGSRREIEEWIRNGELQLNGHPAKLGDRWRDGDHLVLRGRVVKVEKRINAPTRVLVYHKPSGEIVSRRDNEGRPVIFTQLPRLEVGRWIAIGRLDINTQGLILVTNNGELAHLLMHPSQEVEREYAVRVLGQIGEATLERLRAGVELDDGPAHFDHIEAAGGEGANRWFRVIMKEGRNRIVRRLWESQNIAVSRLIRVRFGGVILPPRLKARTFAELSGKELEQLLSSVGLPTEGQAPRADSPRSQRWKSRR